LGHAAVEFDFEAKKTRALPPAEIPAALLAKRACWLDVDARDATSAAVLLHSLGIDGLAIEYAIADDTGDRLIAHEDCLQFRVRTVTVTGGALRFARLDVILKHQLVVTLHTGESELVAHLRRHYQQDFERFAKSIGFLLYEVLDHVTDGYRRAIRVAEANVEQFQSRIFGDVNDEIFGLVASANRDHSALRSGLNAARDVVFKLSSRRSPHVAETTQPFLEQIVDSHVRLGDDLGVAREILSESLDLYMSIVAHRTNRVVTRLTVLSIIFLPLTFLCGVYGMNFKYVPETQWQYGYFAFWIVAIAIASSLLVFMRRRRWL